MPDTERIYCDANISLLESAQVVSRYESQILARTIENTRPSNAPLIVTADPMAMSSFPASNISLSMVPQISPNPDYADTTTSSGQNSVYDTTPELDDCSDEMESQSPIFPRRNIIDSDSSSSSSTEEEVTLQYDLANPNIRTR